MWCPQLLEFNFPDSSLIGMIIEIQSGILEKIQFILSANYLDRAGWSLRHFLNKFKQWHFHSPSNEVIYFKKIKLHAGVKKRHFGNFSARAGMAVPC